MAGKNERCVLCLDKKRSPVLISCGHSFCTECLDMYKSYQKYAWAKRCPICRGSLKEKRQTVKNPLNLNATTTLSGSITGAAAPVEQVYLLEEFMAIATDSDATEVVDFSEEQGEGFYYAGYVDDMIVVDDVETRDVNRDHHVVDEAEDLEILTDRSDNDVVIVDEIIIID